MSVNVGTIEGLLQWKTDSTELDRSLDEVARRANVSRNELDQYNREINSINSTYLRVAASLDPAIAAEQKLEKAQSALSKALRLGLIDQEKYNDLMEKAKHKYADLDNPLETLKSKVGELSSVIGKFGGEAGEGLAKVIEGFVNLGESGLAAVAALGPLIAVAATLAIAAVGVGVAFKGFEVLKDVVSEGLAAQQVVEQLNQTLRTNGSASGLSASQMIEYAGALTLVTGQSDEAIAAGEGILSRFDNIGKDVFPRATRAALDLSQATGKDLDSSFTSLGKVLEGSTRGLRSLQEAGIVLTKGQTAMAEEMIKTGKIAEYQELILSALEEKVGGAAEAFGRTLPGQMSIAREEFGNFKEEIASEIIPALEDVVNGAIDAAGGWETIHRVIVGVAHEIGDVIRKMVYGVAISYHEWETAQDLLDVTILEGFESILNAVSRFAEQMAKLPELVGGGDKWISVSIGAASAANSFGRSADESAASAQRHGAAIVSLTQKMAQHRLALEGDTNVINKNGSALDELGEKTKAQKDATIDLEKAIRSITEAREALLLKSKESLTDSERLLGGLLQGVEVYEQVKRSIAGEKEERALLAPLIKQHSDLIAKNAEVVAKLTAEYGANSPKIREANEATQKEIALNLQARETIIQRSTAIAANSQVIADWTEWQKRSSDAAHAWADNTGKALLSVINLRKQLASDLSSANAGFLDWQEQTAATQKYGKEIAGLLQQYGLLNTASRELAIQEKIRIAIERSGVDAFSVWGKAQIALITTEIRANEEKIAGIKTVQLVTEQATKKNQELIESVGAALTDNVINLINDQLLGDGDKTKEYWENFKRSAIEAVQAWLKSWLQAQVVAQIAGKQTAASVTATGTGGSTGSTVSSAYSAYSGTSGSAVTNIGVAAIVAIWTKVLTGLYEGFTHKNARSGEASFGSGGISESGDRGLAGRASSAIAELIKQIESLSKEWHLGLVKLTAGSVTIGITSAGEYLVKTVIDSFGKVFHSLEEAEDYAKVQALKFADLSSITDKIIADAIHASQAVTTSGLKDDIDFATRIATQNLPEIGLQIRNYTQTFVDDIHHAFDLFGQNSFLNSGNFSALVEATSSSILFFTNSLQNLYNQLTGHKTDVAQTVEANRVAYNAQRAIMVAQITLLYQETQARIAAYQVQRLTGSGGTGAAGGGGATGPSPRPSLPTSGPANKGGGPLPQPTFDPRNPTNDAGLQALLQVLDNLAAALRGLPPPIPEGGAKPGHGGHGGGGNGSNRDSVASFIDDRRFQLSLAAMDAYHQQLAQIDRDYKEQLKNAGKDAKLRTELLALQRQETEAARKQHQKDVTEEFKGLLGPSNAFTDLAKKFDTVKEHIEGAGFGADRAGKMIERLTAAEADAIKKLSTQQFAGLLGDLSSIIVDSDTNTKQHLLHNELLRTQEIVNFQIKSIQMQEEYLILKAQGKLTADQIAILDKAFGWIRDNGNLLPGGKDWVFDASGSVSQAAETLTEAGNVQLDAANELRSAIEGLMDYQTSLHTDSSLGLVNSRQALDNSEGDYESLQARALTGNVDAIKQFKDVAERYRQNLIAFSPSSELTASVLQGIDATINRIKGLPEVQAALSPEGTAIVHGLNYVASGVASLAPITQAVNDNTARTNDRLMEQPTAIADANKSALSEYQNATLDAQKATNDKLQALREDIQLVAGNVLAWRGEARTRDANETAIQTESLGELKKIAAKGKKPVAGVGG